MLKSTAQKAEGKLNELLKLVNELEFWLRDARRRLDMANNEESQIQV